MMKNVIISTLGIEITRKCNLSCDFCARGDAQNVTITKEIIDKILDEIKDYYIGCIRLNGGEPFISPEMIAYLADKIVERNIMVGYFYVFTNGTIKSNLVVESINKIAAYIASNTTTHLQFLDEIIDYNRQRNGRTAGIEFSSAGHYTTDQQINNTRDWYIDHLDFDLVHCKLQRREKQIIQSEKGEQIVKDPTIIEIDGNAMVNYNSLLQQPVNIFRFNLIDNRFSFIQDECKLSGNFKTYKRIFKTISVSANGNVFPGCMMAYSRVDNDPMFNILDCSGDFYEKIDSWCWQNPINQKANGVIKMLEKYDFCKTEKIQMFEWCEVFVNKAYYLKNMILLYEIVAKKLHKDYVWLTHQEIDEMAIFNTALLLIENGVDVSNVDGFINAVFGLHRYSGDTVMLKRSCKNVINECIQLNTQRLREGGIIN